jgi:hypothetical protein
MKDGRGRDSDDGEPAQLIAVFTRWLTADAADPDPWIGVFRHQEVWHQDHGHKVAFVFSADQWDDGVVGFTRSMDHVVIGDGSRYVLIAKVRSVDEVMKLMEEERPSCR